MTVEVGVELALHDLDGAGRDLPGDTSGVVERERQQRVAFHDGVDEAHLLRLFRQDDPAGEQQVGSAGWTHQPGQDPRDAVLGGQPQPPERRGELRPGGGEAQIAEAHQDEAHARSGAVDGGYDGLRQTQRQRVHRTAREVGGLGRGR